MSLTAPVSLSLLPLADPFELAAHRWQSPPATYIDRTSNNSTKTVSVAPRTRFDLLNALRTQLVARADTLSAELISARSRVNVLAAAFIMEDGPTPQVVRGDDYVEVQWLVNGNNVTVTSYDDGENNVTAYSNAGRTVADESFDGDPSEDTTKTVKALLRQMGLELSTRVAY